ncbi:hypothetical protein MFRU_051g00190 [Monilinia fructicola]|nr:hypothetical protein MFRU_051g00190 [Monilinia fructicola]
MDTQDHEETTATRHGDLPTSLIARKDKPNSNSTTTIIKSSSSPSGKKYSPQVIVTESEITMDVDMPDAPPDDIDVKSDSEAETIVLPGKDGHSPSKTRRSIKHEDKSDDEDISKPSESRKRETSSLEAPSQNENHLGRRKRLRLLEVDSSESSKSHPSKRKSPNLQDKRHSSLPKFPAQELGINKSPSPSPPSGISDKAKSVDRAFPRDKQNTSDSGDDHVDHEDRKPAFNGIQSKENTLTMDINAETIPEVTKDRSESPHHGRSHKRSNSTQFPSKSAHGLSHKKRPTPLQYSEYQSDDSSASGRSHPRSSRPRQRTTIGDSTMSPATLHTHKKRVDFSGATPLLNFVRKDNSQGVIEELTRHPEDLNLGDNALNTPLHAASLAGYVRIVRILLVQGCNVDIVNKIGDTPLHDAIENGHVEVVKMLLEHGANPRKAKKAGGDEPSDLAAAYDGDEKTREELQQLIDEAKTKSDASGNTHLSDQMTEESADHDSYSKQSPRPSPTSEYPSGSSRMRARSNKTTDQDLYRDLSKVDMLREACQNGDHGNINKWLDINQSRKDAKSLLIAAKAGDEVAVQLLLGLGNFDRDPEPLKGEDPRWSTPMLCAIHKGHIAVIRCLLSSAKDFDPTRRWQNKTYYEIAQERERGGHNYEIVVETLKNAFYSKPAKSSPSKSRSPKLQRDADRGRDSKRPARAARDRSSPSRKRSPSKAMDTSTDQQKGQHGSSSSLRQSHNAQNQARRGPGRPRKEESNASHPTSDTESIPLGPPKRKLQTPKVAEPDAAAVSSENEPTKPRRKLVSGKELKGERDKRRGSIISNVSTTSVPDRRGAEELKDADGKHRHTSIARPSEPTDEDQTPKPSSIEASFDKGERHDKTKGTKRDTSKDRLASIRSDKSPIKRQRRSTTPPRAGTTDIMATVEVDSAPSKRRKLEGHSKHLPVEEDTSNSNTDCSPSNLDTTSSQDTPVLKASKENTPKMLSKGTGECEARFNTESEEAHKIELANSIDLERKKQAKLAREARDAQKAVEAKQQAKEAKENKEAREAREIEAKEKKAREKEAEAQEAQEAREAQEKLAIEAENAKREQEEEDRKARQAQEDRERAEQQRRLYDEQKRIDREKLEQNRAAAQERERLEKARQAREKEAERLSKLPLLLREFDQLQQAETPRIASLPKFRSIKGYRYDTIIPKATGHSSAREQWMLNTDIALLLGEKDLNLSRYTAWDRVPLDMDIKESIWPLVLAKYSCGLTLDAGGGSTHVPDENAKSLFFGLDLFFVKVSEFMFIVPNFPHLRGLEMAVEYHELVPLGTPPVNKFEQDSDYDPRYPFWPAPQKYMDGTLVTRWKFETKTSTKPFPEPKVPRRDFSRLICNEKDVNRSQRLYNSGPNYQESPQGNRPDDHDQDVGITPPHSDRSRSLNEEGVSQESFAEPTHLLHDSELPNGAPPVPNGLMRHEPNTLA